MEAGIRPGPVHRDAGHDPRYRTAGQCAVGRAVQDCGAGGCQQQRPQSQRSGPDDAQRGSGRGGYRVCRNRDAVNRPDRAEAGRQV